MAGWPLPEVAKVIQQVKHELLDMQELSVVYALQEYRKALPATALVAHTMPPTIAKAAQQVREGLNVLDELTGLYDIQMARIRIDHEHEKKHNKLMASMTKEIGEARDILESIQKVKMDLGLDERHLGTLSIEANGVIEGRYGKDSVRRVLESPASRQKLLGLMERYTSIVNERDKMSPEEVEAPDQDGCLDIDDDDQSDTFEEEAQLDNVEER